MNEFTVENMLASWKADAAIDETQLSKEIVRVPVLHAKYLEYYLHFKRKLAQYEAKKDKMGWQKRKYFRGEMDKDDLAKHGWSQWNGLKPSASELSQLLEFDQDMVDLRHIISEFKSAVSGAEYIMTQLKNREYSLKTLYEYQRYINGA